MADNIPDKERLDVRRRHETANIFSRLPATYAASRMQGQRLLKIGGLSIVEWRILWDVLEAGPITIRDLAELQRADHSQISRVLPKMSAAGWIELQRDKNDGRQTLISLTKEGVAAYERAAPIMAKRRAAFRKYFTEDEIKLLLDLLDRFDVFCQLSVEDILDTE